MSAYQLPDFVWPTVLTGVLMVAAWRGRKDERLAAIGLLPAWILTAVSATDGSNETQWGAFGADVALLALFLWLAVRSQRFWPLFVAAFQLLMVLTHFASMLDAGVTGWAYLTANLIWSYLIVFTIGYAAWSAPAFADDEPDETDPPRAAQPRA